MLEPGGASAGRRVRRVPGRRNKALHRGPSDPRGARAAVLPQLSGSDHERPAHEAAEQEGREEEEKHRRLELPLYELGGAHGKTDEHK